MHAPSLSAGAAFEALNSVKTVSNCPFQNAFITLCKVSPTESYLRFLSQLKIPHLSVHAVGHRRPGKSIES